MNTENQAVVKVMSYNKDDVTKQILNLTKEKITSGQITPELGNSLIGKLQEKLKS